MSEDRVFALADKTFPSLEALHAWFNAQIAGTKDHGERSELRLADRVATARHVERTKAAANEPPAAPPPAPLAPEPFPPEASDDEKATALYGPSLTKSKPERLPVGESRRSLEHKADDEAARRLYGGPIAFGGGDVKNPHSRQSEYPATPGET